MGLRYQIRDRVPEGLAVRVNMPGYGGTCSVLIVAGVAVIGATPLEPLFKFPSIPRMVFTCQIDTLSGTQTRVRDL